MVGIAAVPVACLSQITTLDKGHQLLVNSGLQIWGCDTGASSFTYSNLSGANINAVMWSHGQSKAQLLAAGQKWGKWVDYLGNPATALNSTEQARYADLVAIQVGDEQQTDMETPNSQTTVWFQNARAGNHFNDKLLYVNSFFINSDAAYATFIANANPDAISFDAYPFGTGGIQPINWLGKAQQFRRHALSAYIGAGINSPRPYGLYLQTYSSTSEQRRDPGDLEMRWQMFTVWTLGYTFVDAFTVGGASSLFHGGSMNDPMDGSSTARSPPRHSWFKESARQSLNLGPALVRLVSYSNGAAGGGTSIVRGRDPSGNLNPLPISWKDFSPNDAPPNQRYLIGVSATNLGSKNNGHPGDVYIGFFNPLHPSYGNPAGTTYFMVTNALGAYLQDETLLATDCTQRITLDFDFSTSGINSLLRLSRDNGRVEVVPLTHVTGSQYRLVFDLAGGTGDLFKYNDGTPFVGVPFQAAMVYWDGDGNALNNNLSTGSGLGGSGTWDSTTSGWYNGVLNFSWVNGNEAIFWGAPGTVTLANPQSASGLTFKTTGYTLSGSTLTMTGPSVAVDAGLTATINSIIAGSAGLVKNGAGTLNLATNNSYTGGTIINEGVLGIISGALGANPPSPTVNVVINHGATLRFNQNNLTLTAQRQIELGPDGGVIDTAFNNGINGVISGTTLIKTGTGTLTLSAANSHTANIISEGRLQVSSDVNLGAVPATFTAANITLDGGTLRFGANFDPSNNRGIMLGENGGTIDTQGFTNPSGYTQPNGIQGGGDLTKIGSGTFYMKTPAGQLNNSWSGNLILKEGTWKITERGGLPFNPPTNGPVYPGQITFDGGTLQIAGVIPNVTNGRRGITVSAGGGTIDTQGFDFNWAGPLASDSPTSVLTKIGSGTLQFNTNNVPAPSTFAGLIHVAEGSLVINGGSAMGPLASIHLADVSGVSLTVSHSATTIGSLSGGGSMGGNATLLVNLTTGGNNQSTTFGGTIGGPGGLVKTGTGSMRLTAINTYAGPTTVAGGKLVVDGSLAGHAVVQNDATLSGGGTIAGHVTVHAGGTLAPGNSPGTISVGGLILLDHAVLQMEIGPTSDRVIVVGNGSLGGTLTVSLVEGFTPSLGQTFAVLTAGSLTGEFSQGLLPSFSSRTFEIIYHPQSVILRVVPLLPGDFNGDDTVDAADYVVWRKTSGSGEDFEKWRANFGRAGEVANETVNIQADNSAVVPEATSWMLWSVGAALLFSGRGFWLVPLHRAAIGN